MKVRALQKPKTLAELKRELKCTANPVTRWALKEIIKKKGARQMNNADKPAMPIPRGVYNNDTAGLTKREQACLTMGVADTGDAELDAIITKGNKNKFAGLAMKGLLAHYGTDGAGECALYAVDYANALLKALEQDDE